MTDEADRRVYFFGCVRSAGHYLFAPGPVSARESDISGWPWRWGQLDALYAPGGQDGPQKLGVARVVHHEGWTVMALWDRSVDTRHNSNAAFIASDPTALLSFNHMKALAAEHFPAVWGRINAQCPVRSVVRGDA